MHALETDIAKLKSALVQAKAAEQRRRLEREAELKRISGMVVELVALHESYYWSGTVCSPPIQRRG